MTAATAAALGLLVAATALAALFDRVALALLSGGGPAAGVADSLRAAAQECLRRSSSTERPDRLNWALAPVLYLVLAAVGVAVVPLAPGFVAIESEAGIVIWGACEALMIVAVFLHGWSANAPFALIGGYRFVAIGLAAMLLSMFVLIAAALPAESLAVPAIVEAQATLWNVVRQPLGLPLFALLGLTVSLRHPFDYADSFDLAGGTQAEISGGHRIAWQVARLAMLAAVAAVASAVFLGGYHGPVLPGPVWVLLKTAGILALLVVAGHFFARLPPARMLSLLWVVLLPLSFLSLAGAGLEALR